MNELIDTLGCVALGVMLVTTIVACVFGVGFLAYIAYDMARD